MDCKIELTHTEQIVLDMLLMNEINNGEEEMFENVEIIYKSIREKLRDGLAAGLSK